MRLKCQCCGFEQAFADAEAAFQAGWDAPPHFSTHVCCPLCPAVCVVMGMGHKRAHALWAANGRPAEFSVETCGADDTMDDPHEIERLKADMEGMRLAQEQDGLAGLIRYLQKTQRLRQ